jgi:hypothetical protein
MLTVYFSSLLIVLLFTPFGLILSNKNQKNLAYFSSQLLYGLIILSFLALFLNFFLPLDKTLNTLILILPIILIFKNKKEYFNKQFLLFLILSGILISLLILESNVYRPDAGLYHLPYTKILNDEKIIIGLANFHFRYAHISIVQYLSAISNNIIFVNNGIVFAQALIASSVIINFSYKVYKYNKNKEYNFHFFYLVSTIIFIFYKMNRYSEYGNDAPSHFLFFFLISEILNSKTKEIRDICNNFLIILFIILNKITLLLAVFLPLLDLKQINFKKLFKLKRLYFLTIFALLWFVKNLLISGCVLYPIKSLCFNSFVWTDIQKVQEVSSENEVWSKGWPDYIRTQNKNSAKIVDKDTYLKKFYWLPYWSKNHLKKILNIIIPYVLFLTALVIYLNYSKDSIKNFKIEKKYYFLIIIMFFSTLFWFIKVPTFRYGYSYLISFISLIFALICVQFNFKKNIQKFFNFLLIFCFSILIFKNVIRISKSENGYNNYPWPKYFSMNEGNLNNGVEELTLNGKKLYKPKKNGYCMFSDSPCGNYGIYDGLNFVIKNNYNIFYKD